MRILVMNWKDLAHPAAGGAEVFTHEVTRRWAAWGHEVTLFCAAADGRPTTERIERVRVVRRGSRWTVYREARLFYRREGRGGFDLVVDEVNTRPFLCPTYVDDAPVVALIHQVAREVWFYEMPWPLALVGRYYLEPRWLACYRHVPVVTVSESSRRSLEEYGITRLTVIPQGVTDPTSLRPPKKEARPTAIFVGRMSANKRPGHAIRAFQMARPRVPDAQLWMVGSGLQEAALRARADQGVHFFGKVSQQEKFELMARAHTLVVTSVREGWGMVVDEAAAVGTPAIGYDVPGLRDSVPAAGGVLVAPRPTALAQELVRCLPAWAARPPAGPHRGGAVDWSAVARTFLDSVSPLVSRGA